jgi:putative hydrolase of the HAD superfamily
VQALTLDGMEYRKPKAVFIDAGIVLILPDLQRMARHFDVRDQSDAALYSAFVQAFSNRQGDTRPESAWLWETFATAIGAEPAIIPSRIGDPVEQMNPWHNGIAAPGAIELLRALEQENIPVVVVSNTHDGQVDKMLVDAEVCQVGAGPLASVAAIVDSHLVGVRKPDPAIFEHASDALERARSIRPARGELVMIDDAYWSGVLSALDAAIPAIHLLPEGSCERPGTHHDVRTLDEVAVLIGLSPIARNAQRNTVESGAGLCIEPK